MALCHLETKDFIATQECFNIGSAKGTNREEDRRGDKGRGEERRGERRGERKEKLSSSKITKLYTEKQRLPFFKHQKTLHDQVAHFLHILKELSKRDIPPTPANNNSIHNEPRKEKRSAKDKFNDPRRIEIILHDRQQKASKKKMGKNQTRMTHAPLKQQPPLTSLSNLKSLVLEDIDLCKDKVYQGYVHTSRGEVIKKKR